MIANVVQADQMTFGAPWRALDDASVDDDSAAPSVRDRRLETMSVWVKLCDVTYTAAADA